jgi:hypothetical protein
MISGLWRPTFFLMDSALPLPAGLETAASGTIGGADLVSDAGPGTAAEAMVAAIAGHPRWCRCWSYPRKQLHRSRSTRQTTVAPFETANGPVCVASNLPEPWQSSSASRRTTRNSNFIFSLPAHMTASFGGSGPFSIPNAPEGWTVAREHSSTGND